MIKIKQSKSADTRSAENLVSKQDLLVSSIQHIKDVNQALAWMRMNLMDRAGSHDWTKVNHIDQFHQDFIETQKSKGTKDFTQMEWYKLHINVERHHLKERCPSDVNLFDVLERIADIVMAGMARTGKVYDDNLPPELFIKAYKNTITLLKNQIEVESEVRGE